MKAQKTHRHDEIKDLVLDTVIKRENQAVASQEPTIWLPSRENLKPDLVIKSQERVCVVNVTVYHKDKDELTGRHQSKLDKYAPLLLVLWSRMGVATGELEKSYQ